MTENINLKINEFKNKFIEKELKSISIKDK